MSLFGKRKTSAVLIIDVGNGSVGAAVALLSPSRPPEIISFGRELILFNEKPTAKRLQAIIVEKMQVLLPDVRIKAFTHSHFKNNPRRFDTVLCVLSSPWFVAQGKTITLSQDRAFRISEDFIADIVHKQSKAFEKELSGISGLTRLEETVLGMRIDDATAEKIIDASTKHFELSLYMSRSDKKFINTITDTITADSHIPVQHILFHSFPLVAFSCIRDIALHSSEYVHIDVAGEITDVSWISRGMVQQVISFPVGKNLLIRKIASYMKSGVDTARAALHAAQSLRVHVQTESNVLKGLEYAEKEWNEQLEKALKGIMKESHNELPQDVFITAYPETADIFSRFLKTDTLGSTSVWRKNMRITPVNEEFISKYVKYPVHESHDAFLSLEALFLSRFVQNS